MISSGLLCGTAIGLGTSLSKVDCGGWEAIFVRTCKGTLCCVCSSPAHIPVHGSSLHKSTWDEKWCGFNEGCLRDGKVKQEWHVL